MQKLLFALLLILFLACFSFTREEEKSPLYFAGVDAGMSPQETTKVLGKPQSTQEMAGTLVHYYTLSDGTNFSLFFYKSRWLCNISITFGTAIHMSELGLTSEGGQGFEVNTFEHGAKIWRKTIDTKKFGKIVVTYGTKQGDKTSTLIGSKSMTMLVPTIFEE